MGAVTELRRFHGSRVGQMAQRVYLCISCGAWQVDPRSNRPLAKPDFFCMASGCNGTQFHHFPSLAEAKSYATLLLRQRQGEIADLELQPRFELHAPTPANGRVKIGAYVGDFRFRVIASGEIRVIDVKGDGDTHMSAWKRKHAEAEHGITIAIMRS